MITLYGFGPHFGLPDASPFVMKAMLLLKMAGLDYQENHGGYKHAPKGKLPFIDDDGELISDSTFIRFHIEKKYGFDFDAHLSPEQKATSWAFEKMCEDHLYWAMIDLRWLDPDNFKRGPAQFFKAAPKPLQPLLHKLVQRRIRKRLCAHGLGLHSAAQIVELTTRDIDALSVCIGGKPYLFGDHPCAADASVFGSIAALLSPTFESPVRAAVEAHANLRAYRDRMMDRYFLYKKPSP
ncbi:MAG: glutathione S-transferase [Verrucomicrobiaceae bacterium]|nr:glutathione S-transferase [Verrucomicrobiaceae bacterium]